MVVIMPGIAIRVLRTLRSRTAKVLYFHHEIWLAKFTAEGGAHKYGDLRVVLPSECESMMNVIDRLGSKPEVCVLSSIKKSTAL